MPKRSRAEMIAAKQAELAALYASEDKSQLAKAEKLRKEIAGLDERIGKLNETKQAKTDELALIEHEIEEAKSQAAPADAGVPA